MKIQMFFIFLLFASLSLAQFIEVSFPAPSDNISGLAFNGTVWAIDSVDCCIYGVDMWTGVLQDTVLLPAFDNPPVGLGVSPECFWFAESGTAIIHSIDFDGNLVSTMDFSDSGVQNISGVEHFQWYPSYPYLWFIDSADRSIYTVCLSIGPQTLNKVFSIEEEIVVHDIGWESMGVPVACDDELSPVRFYENGNSYEPLGMGSYQSAIGVATTLDDRIYFSDPEMGMIHRYSWSTVGVTAEGTSSVLPRDLMCSVDNPVRGEVELVVQLEDTQLIHIQVYSLFGRLVKEIAGSIYPQGTQTVSLGTFSPGVYLYHIISESNTLSRAFTVLE